MGVIVAPSVSALADRKITAFAIMTGEEFHDFPTERLMIKAAKGDTYFSGKRIWFAKHLAGDFNRENFTRIHPNHI